MKQSATIQAIFLLKIWFWYWTIFFICSFAKFILYADDANIIISENNIAELQNKIELLLEKLQSWVNVNGLKLNIQKTKYMIFSNVEKTDLNIKIKSTPISRSRCEKFLGILVDDSLSWTDHINGLASKISRNVGILYKLKGIVPESVLRTLYNSFVQSNLNYCSGRVHKLPPYFADFYYFDVSHRHGLWLATM